jgi:thiosulfate dehydrogenase (quinone)
MSHLGGKRQNAGPCRVRCRFRSVRTTRWVLLARNPARVNGPWFPYVSGSLSLPLADSTFRTAALAVLGCVIAFNVGTYSYFRGSVVTPFHGGPVSPTAHHITISDAVVLSDGAVRLHVSLDAGTAEAPVHVVRAVLKDVNKHVVAEWNTQALSKLPKSAFQNDYDYNKFGPGPFGIRAPMGVAATITLTRPDMTAGSASPAMIELIDVDNRVFSGQLSH